MVEEEKQFWTQQFEKLKVSEDKLIEWAEKHGKLTEKAVNLEGSIRSLNEKIDKHVARSFWCKALDWLIQGTVIALFLFIATILATTLGVPVGEFLRSLALDALAS